MSGVMAMKKRAPFETTVIWVARAIASGAAKGKVERWTKEKAPRGSPERLS
jgi:hypothetical protein